MYSFTYMLIYSMMSLPPNNLPNDFHDASRRQSHLPGRRIGARLGGRRADDEVGWEGGARQVLGGRTCQGHGPFGKPKA